MSSYRFVCAGDAREEAQEAEATRGRQGAQEAEKGEEAEKAAPQSRASGRNGQRILAHAIVPDLSGGPTNTHTHLVDQQDQVT